jgi:anti-sigma28 factor (negative regulator of flagellin synthesis)
MIVNKCNTNINTTIQVLQKKELDITLKENTFLPQKYEEIKRKIDTGNYKIDLNNLAEKIAEELISVPVS